MAVTFLKRDANGRVIWTDQTTDTFLEYAPAYLFLVEKDASNVSTFVLKNTINLFNNIVVIRKVHITYYENLNSTTNLVTIVTPGTDNKGLEKTFSIPFSKKQEKTLMSILNNIIENTSVEIGDF